MKFDASNIEKIYQTYPKHVAKVAALTAIAKALVTLSSRPELPDPARWLLDRVRTYAASPAGRQGQYTPLPAKWFNEGRYEDNPAEWQREATFQAGSKSGSVNLAKPITAF